LGAIVNFSYLLDIPSDKSERRSTHRAKIEVKYISVKIRKPSRLKNSRLPEYVELRVLEAKESIKTVKTCELAVHWILLTTHKISSNKFARQIIEWYRCR